jgi:hypothetical protein
MLYAEIKRETLGHINQATMAGVPVHASYNNQADYLNRIPELINEGVLTVRTTVKPEPVVFQLTEGEVLGDLIRYQLPEDFWSLRTGGVSIIQNGHFQKSNDYRLQGKDYILTPNNGAAYTVEYYRYPNKLPSAPADDFDLLEDEEVIRAATYYAAANLVLLEDEFAYTSLMNDFETRMVRITRGPVCEVQPVQDVFAFYGG